MIDYKLELSLKTYFLYYYYYFRYLSTECSFRSLAFTFRMGKTSVARIEEETCEANWDKLSTVYIPEPTVDDWKTNANDFFVKWNFPNCLGSIDGKHIRIDQPQHSGSMYYNYKHFFFQNIYLQFLTLIISL